MYRWWQIYEDLFNQLLSMRQAEARGHKARFRFKHPLPSLDSTAIPLRLAMCEWASMCGPKERSEALISMLLLRWLHVRSSWRWRFANLNILASSANN
ncbi:MAG: hypothetical protein HXY18_10415 [Bryobacteraceae bacterium]|nr:hypothetical protein [Bryobacteraceae bacterium]